MSDDKRYTLSLSRWHTVVERLSAQADARAREAVVVLDGTQVSFVLEPEQIETLKARGAEAVTKIALARQGFAAVATIRSALAKANAELGVSQLLAEQAGVRREQKLLREVGQVDVALRASLDKVNDRLVAQQQSGASDRMSLRLGQASIPVAVVSAEVVAQARQAAIDLEQRLAVVSDQINDLNKQTVAISLPLVLAKEAGLEG